VDEGAAAATALTHWIDAGAGAIAPPFPRNEAHPTHNTVTPPHNTVTPSADHTSASHTFTASDFVVVNTHTQ